MYRFIETMLVMGGKIRNASYHNKRLNNTLSHFRGDKSKEWNVEEIISSEITKISDNFPDITLDNYKARIQYNLDEVEEVSLTPYSMREVKSLKCVYNDDIDYTYKNIDRSQLNEAFASRGECDDALIVRNGMLTDTTVANVALWNGENWITPSKPLLKGTQRAYLIDKGILMEDDISIDDLGGFSKIRLFNALIEWGKIEIENMNQIII